jgi:hypothetical protein
VSSDVVCVRKGRKYGTINKTSTTSLSIGWSFCKWYYKMLGSNIKMPRRILQQKKKMIFRGYNWNTYIKTTWITNHMHSGFGGLVVSMLASGTRVRGFKPSLSRWIFFGHKNPQHAFLWKGSKAVCPMSQICGMIKNPCEVGSQGKICRPFLTRA